MQRTMKTLDYSENLFQAVRIRLEQIQPLTYQNCVSAELPPFLLHALKPKIEQLFDREKPLLVKRPERFDFQDPGLKAELAKLKTVLLAHYRLKPEEVQSWLKGPIYFTAELFISPFATLPRLAVKDNQVNLKALRDYLHQFPFDFPLKQALSEGMPNTASNIIGREHFQQILQDVRYQLYHENMLSVFLQDLHALKALYQWLTGGEIDVFSRGVILRMFEDRGITDILQVLRNEPATVWSIQDIQNFVERFHLVGDLETNEDTRESLYVEENVGDLVLDEVVQSSNGQHEVVWERSGDIALIHDEITENENDEGLPEKEQTMNENASQPQTFQPTPETQSHDAESTPEAMNKEAINTDEGEASDAVETPPEAAAEQEENTDEFEQEIVRGFRTQRRVVVSSENPVIDREKLEEQPPGPYPSLYTFMDQKTRKVFIKKLFGNDEQAFEAFVEKVDQAESWKEAKAIFDAELSRRNISVYSKNAIKLSDFLFSRYFSRNRY